MVLFGFLAGSFFCKITDIFTLWIYHHDTRFNPILIAYNTFMRSRCTKPVVANHSRFSHSTTSAFSSYWKDRKTDMREIIFPKASMRALLDSGHMITLQSSYAQFSVSKVNNNRKRARHLPQHELYSTSSVIVQRNLSPMTSGYGKNKYWVVSSPYLLLVRLPFWMIYKSVRSFICTLEITHKRMTRFCDLTHVIILHIQNS